MLPLNASFANARSNVSRMPAFTSTNRRCLSSTRASVDLSVSLPTTNVTLVSASAATLNVAPLTVSQSPFGLVSSFATS